MSDREDRGSGRIDRRTFIKLSAVAGGAATTASTLGLTGTNSASAAAATSREADDFPWLEATIADLQSAMASGRTNALALTRAYLERIEDLDLHGPKLNSVIEANPSAEAIASRLDQERSAGHVRGPLHGIPILLKDNIATDDA